MIFSFILPFLYGIKLQSSPINDFFLEESLAICKFLVEKHSDSGCIALNRFTVLFTRDPRITSAAV